jgi:hypothetical protein
MRTRAHMGVMLAAAAALAGVEALGAQRMVLPALNIPSLALGSGNSKAGKHRNSGSGSPRPNDTTFWDLSGKGRGGMHATQAKEAAKRVARWQAGSDLEWQKRMRWNETVYPRVLEHQARQRAAARRPGRPVRPHRSGGQWP